MKPPACVQVGPYRIYIEVVEPMDNDGVFYAQEQRIQLNKAIGPDIQRETLLHELFHAVAHVAGLNSGNHSEEAWARRAVPVLLDCLQRNPRLRNFLFGETS